MKKLFALIKTEGKTKEQIVNETWNAYQKFIKAKKPLRKYIYIAGFVILALAGSIYFIPKLQNEPPQLSDEQFSALRCPDEYANSRDKIKAFDMFVSAFFEINPGATYADLAQARHDFYVEFNCTKALKREADYQNGKVDPETKASIERVIDETFNQ